MSTVSIKSLNLQLIQNQQLSAQIKVLFLLLLSRIPGQVSETFFVALLWNLFIVLQCVVISMSDNVSMIELLFIAIQATVVFLLSVKLVIWFNNIRANTNSNSTI